MSSLCIVAGTAVSYLLAVWIGMPALVPALNTLPAFPFLLLALRDNRTTVALVRMLLWALVLAVCSTGFAYLDPVRTEAVFINAGPYRQEMLEWILTGEGRESSPAQFIPQHVAHAALFCGLALFSGGVLAMPMGALLMNYMGHYVGWLASVSAEPTRTMLLGWHPWAVLRVASFVTLGVVLAGPVLSRVAGFRYRLADHRRLVAGALAGLVIDVLLKGMLAPTWSRLLRASLS